MALQHQHQQQEQWSSANFWRAFGLRSLRASKEKCHISSGDFPLSNNRNNNDNGNNSNNGNSNKKNNFLSGDLGTSKNKLQKSLT